MLGFCPVSAAPVATAPSRPPQVVRPPSRSYGALLGFGPLGAAPLSAVPTAPPPEVVAIGAELVEAASAGDVADAGVVPAFIVIIPGGGRREPLRLEPVEGVGYGILPALVGEAHGVVVAASTGAAMLHSLAGEAAGAVGAGGQGAAPLTVKAAASGVRGAKGGAVGVLGLEAGGAGAIGVCGKGFGVIGNLEAAGFGRQDDDAAVAAWLLAA